MTQEEIIIHLLGYLKEEHWQHAIKVCGLSNKPYIEKLMKKCGS